MKINFPDSAKVYMQLQCNGKESDYTHCPEITTEIAKFLYECKPKNVLELGCGLGRMSVFLRRLLGWVDVHFYMLDGDYGDEQIAGIHSEIGPNYYNSLSATREFCLANGMDDEHLTIIDADHHDFELPLIDLCYSFKAIGFHWPINEYLDIVYKFMRPGGHLLFELRDTRKESYPDVRWPRIKNFVENQLIAINARQFSIISCNTERSTPILVLERL